MFAAFRRLSKSWVGTVIIVLFLLAILASFAIADIANVRSSGFGSLGAGTLAKVGDEEVSERDMSNAMRRALQRLQEQNPDATYASMGDQFGPVLDSLINERALLAFAADHGFVLSKRLVDAEIANLPATRGLDGKFNEQAYAAFLQQQQLTDAELRRLLQVALTQRAVLAPAAVDARVPIGVARAYASMLLEEREGQVVLVPTDVFRAGLNPSDGDLQSFYGQNRQRYIVPEQRVLRMARIGPDAVAGATPTPAEIEAYYKANQATYAGSESRVISQILTQDKKIADAAAARARSGASFVDAAKLANQTAEDISVGPQTRAQFAGLAGEAVANAAFAAGKGAIVGPVRSDLGWHVIKIDDIRGASGRSLEAVRGEIATLLSANKRKETLTDLITKVEDQIADGASFSEAAAAAKLAVTATPPVSSGGSARSDLTYRFPTELAPVLKAGFAMTADDPAEVITLPNEAGFVLVAVDRIIEAAPAPLAEIKDRVRADWIQRKASDRAQAVASEIAAKVARGQAIDQAVAAAGAGLPAVQPIKARRFQVGQAGPDAVAPMRMLFSLAQGRSRMVADPRGRGFFVVKANSIKPGNALSNPSLIAQVQGDFQRLAVDELGAQMLAAIKADQKVKRNEAAIAAAKQRITGTGE